MMTPLVYQITLTEFQRDTLISLMDQQFDLHDTLSLKLDQAYALSHVTAHWPDFSDIPAKLSVAYLEALYHLLYRVVEFHETVHQAFLQMTQLIPAQREEPLAGSP